MVVVDPVHKAKLHDSDVVVAKHLNSHHHSTELQLKHAFAGGLSGGLTRALCQPFDMLKIRFQLQVEPVARNQKSKYKSMMQAMRLVSKEEGIVGLWKGHNPAQVLSIIFGISQFWCYEELVANANEYKIFMKHQALTNFACGGIAGAMATFFASPLDVVRTRLIAQDFSKGYKNSYQVIS